jgi:hypothetical protein
MKKLLFLVIIGLCATKMFAQTEILTISEWLTIPAQKLNYPVFHELENTQGKTFNDENLLNFPHFNLSNHFPAKNEVFAIQDGKQMRWTPLQGGRKRPYRFGFKNDQPQMAYLATYMWAERWMQAAIEDQQPLHAQSMAGR